MEGFVLLYLMRHPPSFEEGIVLLGFMTVMTGFIIWDVKRRRAQWKNDTESH